MGSSHTLDQLDICFDDTHAIANAGLLLPGTLAERLGIQQTADALIDLGERPGRTDQRPPLSRSPQTGCRARSTLLPHTHNRFKPDPQALQPASNSGVGGSRLSVRAILAHRSFHSASVPVAASPAPAVPCRSPGLCARCRVSGTAAASGAVDVRCYVRRLGGRRAQDRTVSAVRTTSSRNSPRS
jgi:hypothetical protein